MIEALNGFPKGVVAVAGKGHVTKHDYEAVLIPAVQEAFQQQGQLRLYYQIGPGFLGIEPGAIWEDFKVGMEHLSRWERIAVVTDVDWIQHTVRAFSFVLPGQVKVFSLDQQAEAREWILERVAHT